MEMIMRNEPKFKSGDKVRCLSDNGASKRGQVYTVHKIWYNTMLVKWYMQLVEHLTELPNHSHSVGVYELVEPNPVLTPEEVFEHLRKGTKLQYRRQATLDWAEYICGSKVTDNPTYKMIALGLWRIKPEPEVIELNGKRYKLIEE